MMRTIVIIGAGPGGLAAAIGAKEAGADRVIVLERDSAPGGILNQCIHDGFGLIRYKKQLTGTEYAEKAVAESLAAGAEILTGHHVIRIDNADGCHIVTTISRDGIGRFKADAVIISTGCRERTRGAISIPGSRPAGVFTAGVVQNLVNIRNVMPGRRVVILGSGDIGMIMARRLTLEGAEVKAVIEILPQPAGLARNVSQCLYDYGIPIHCSHTVSRIIGKKKIEAVEISALDQDMKPVRGTEEIIECDALILSVGLIPENEVAETAGVKLDPKTNGTVTDEYLQTSVPGIFSCGNSRRIMDLADFVSEQGELAGRNAVAYLSGTEMTGWDEARSTSMAKGYPQADTVTCTLCPNGCQVRFHDGKYEGNKCPRGIQFAEQERTQPKRVLTTTVKTSDGRLLPVKTENSIDKSVLFDAIRELRENTDPDGALSNAAGGQNVQCGDRIAMVHDGNGKAVAVIATASE